MAGGEQDIMNELQKLYKDQCLSNVVKLKRLQWAGHIQCMNSRCIPRKLLYNTNGGKRPVSKPKRRWNEAVEENSRKILGIRNWKKRSNG
jgi:hypothetical protein